MPQLIDHVAWLRTLAQSNTELERLRATYRFNPLEREVVLGLKWKKGDIVHDRITDQRATVLASTRKRFAAPTVPGASEATDTVEGTAGRNPGSPNPGGAGEGASLLKFEAPTINEVEPCVVRLADGKVVARTAEELLEESPKE